jgi:uncharacterized protein (TIGR04255 family)
VHQVILGVAFEPLLRLRASHIGLFWGEINKRNEYPFVEEFRPSRLLIERFDDDELPEAVELSVAGTEPVPRVLLSSGDYSRQIALQRDALQVSWRKVDDAPYPRFESPRDLFQEMFSSFLKFLESQGLGRMRLRQAEVSYINSIPFPRGDVQAQAETLVSFKLVTGKRIPSSDHFHTFQRHTLESDGKPWARLYITFDSDSFQPVTPEMPGGGKAEGQLSFTVQGPVRDRDEAFGFLEKGHKVIVDSFVATMTSVGKTVWGEIEGGA